MNIKSFPEVPWYIVENADDIPSPVLLVYPNRIEANIFRMISISSGVHKLRPHVKTHKMAEIVRLQMKHGINKFKCATVAEAEMVARCGVADIMLAMQPVGPAIDRFFQLKKQYGAARFSCLTDSEEIVMKISECAARQNAEAGIWLDINNGMNRTGISPGNDAIRLYRTISNLPGLKVEGIHVYDGHIRENNFAERKKICDEAFKPVLELNKELSGIAGSLLPVVAGGTPTFPIHALRQGVEASPGTVLLWDYGYSSSFSDLEFLHAAVIMTRIVSKPAGNLICTDLGHKAIASEMPQPRIEFPGLESYEITGHNEEHMVIRTENAGDFKTGDILYGIPWHICPTVDRYETVTVVNDGKATGEWVVEARKRRITV